jgi:hypothetical protein
LIAILAIIPLLFGFFLTIAEAQQKMTEKAHEGAIYLRMMLLAVAGSLIAMAMAEMIDGWAVLVALAVVSIALVVSHLVGRKLAGGGFANSINNGLQRVRVFAIN